MLRIVYRNYEFKDTRRDVIAVKGSLHQSMIADALSADECTLTVKYNPAALGYYINDSSHGSGWLYTVLGEIYMCRTSDQATIDSNMDAFEGGFVNAEPVDIYEDETFFKRFYVTQTLPVRVNRDGSVVIQLRAVSFIGLTVSMSHNGGLYTNSTVGAIIAEILQGTKNTSRSTASLFWYDMPGGLHYTMDAKVANTRADGHLPITDRYRSARDNIRDVCFGYGVSVLQLPDGSAQFTFNQPSSVINIPDEEIYSGDAYTRHQSLTAVKVIANTYRQYAEEDPEILWEGQTVVSHAKVIFDEPCWGLYSSQVGGVDTITIEESGVNYAIISGSGTLYGIPYLHNQEEFSRTIGTGVENVKTASCGMVTLLNYQNVLDRMAAYYGQAREISASVVVKNGASTGSLISFNDPLGRQKTGIINEMAFTMSGIIKGDLAITTNWTPTDVGNNFSMSQILTGSGTWTKAAAEAAVGHSIDIVRFDLISGGDGGAPGADGTAGALNTAGKGGAGGAGGQSGKVFSITLEGDQIPASITFSCGAGGAAGSAGGATTATISGTTYSSEAGARTNAGYMDLIDGTVRATPGPDGIKGGDGGDNQTGVGESVTYKDRTWTAGAMGESDGEYRRDLFYNASYNPPYLIDYRTLLWCSAPGGSTGGAAFGANSAPSTAGTLGRTYTSSDATGRSAITAIASAKAGNASKGANALPIDDYTPTLGSGGAGGNGGGGGGAGDIGTNSGGQYIVRGSMTTPTTIPANNIAGSAGAKGTGSAGTAGGAGFITVYF